MRLPFYREQANEGRRIMILSPETTSLLGFPGSNELPELADTVIEVFEGEVSLLTRVLKNRSARRFRS